MTLKFLSRAQLNYIIREYFEDRGDYVGPIIHEAIPQTGEYRGLLLDTSHDVDLIPESPE